MRIVRQKTVAMQRRDGVGVAVFRCVRARQYESMHLYHTASTISLIENWNPQQEHSQLRKASCITSRAWMALRVIPEGMSE